MTHVSGLWLKSLWTTII